MTAPRTSHVGDLSSLPRWARDRLCNAEERADNAEETYRRMHGDLNDPETTAALRVGGTYDTAKPLGKYAWVVFYLDRGDREHRYVSVYVSGERLVVQADQPLLIEPRAGNSFEVLIPDRRTVR